MSDMKNRRESTLQGKDLIREDVLVALNNSQEGRPFTLASSLAPLLSNPCNQFSSRGPVEMLSFSLLARRVGEFRHGQGRFIIYRPVYHLD